MTTVNETTSQAGLALAQAGSNSAAQGIQDQFLTLLVTQLRNQDPLNPMENAELTSQLAQISTVEGINNLKEHHARHQRADRRVAVDGRGVDDRQGRADAGRQRCRWAPTNDPPSAAPRRSASICRATRPR